MKKENAPSEGQQFSERKRRLDGRIRMELGMTEVRMQTEQALHKLLETFLEQAANAETERDLAGIEDVLVAVDLLRRTR